MRTHLLILVLLCIAGCRTESKEARYSRAFFASVQRYAEVAGKMVQQRAPVGPELTREEKLDAFSDILEADGRSFQVLVDDFRRLEPPRIYEDLHRTYLEFLSGQVKINRQHVEALRAHDEGKARRVAEGFIAFYVSQRAKILQEIEKAGGEIGEHRERLKSVMGG